MKITGFKLSFNPQKAFYFFCKILLGILLTAIIQSPFTIAFTGSNMNKIYNGSYFRYNFIMIVNFLLFMFFIGLVGTLLYFGIKWIIDNGDKEIELDLTKIKIKRTKKYKELSK